MSRRAGFSLTELMMTLVVLGLLATFSIPAVTKALSGWNLHTSRELIVSEVKLLREKAIAEGRARRIWFSPSSSYYWFQNPTTGIWTPYNLPSRVTFYSVSFSPPGPYDTYFEPDGRSLRSGTIILTNDKGKRDTLVVNLSGWIGEP